MSEINKYNGMSEHYYEDLREDIKNNPQRRKRIHEILQQELKDPAEVHN
jgi:hypothetical protein